MRLSFALTIFGLALVLVAIVATLLFGHAALEIITALLRIFFSGFSRVLQAITSALLTIGWYIAGVLLIVVVGGGALVYFYWFKPGGFDLTGLRPPSCVELVDRQGDVFDYVCPPELKGGVRIWRPLETISDDLKSIVVMLEDDKFYEHGGLDIDEIWNALEKDIEKKKLARGGSTITQQLAKNLFLTKEKSIFRKASEVPLTIRLEREFSKDEILELYLNTIEWGPGVFGAEAASRLYFDHAAASLTTPEVWLLALMIPNPVELNLWIAPRAQKSLLKRARHLATRLWQEHHLSKKEAGEALTSFTTFLDQWAKSRPIALRTGRKYPARWVHEHAFSVAEVVSVRRGATGWFKRFKHAPLKLTIDRRLQEQLESLQPSLHAQEAGDVITIMDGKEIRAMIPATRRTLIDLARPIAEGRGLSIQVFPSRNIPPKSIWR